jgi:RNA polymerase sporulation-specific sigma factor
LEEIAAEIGVSEEDVVMAMEAGNEVESLYKTIYQGDGNAIFLIDKIEEEKDVHNNIVNRMVVEELMETLDEKERELIKMRYFKEKTQTEIAAELGISQVQVSRLEKKILKSLRLLIE